MAACSLADVAERISRLFLCEWAAIPELFPPLAHGSALVNRFLLSQAEHEQSNHSKNRRSGCGYRCNVPEDGTRWLCRGSRQLRNARDFTTGRGQASAT